MHCVCSYYLTLFALSYGKFRPGEPAHEMLMLWVINVPLFLTEAFHVLCQHPWNCVRLTYSLASWVQFQTLYCSWKLCICPSRNADCVLVTVPFLWISDNRSIFFGLIHWWAFNTDQRLANCCLPSRPNLAWRPFCKLSFTWIQPCTSFMLSLAATAELSRCTHMDCKD